VPRVALIASVVLLSVLAGCGDSSEEATTAPGADQDGAAIAKVRLAFERDPGCKRPQGASRWGCSVGAYRCQGVVSGRGWSISCAKPGGSLGFTIPRD
jgi:hypothetical protein